MQDYTRYYHVFINNQLKIGDLPSGIPQDTKIPKDYELQVSTLL
jgi:hypothetical protein